MRTSIRTIMLAATCLAAILLIGNLGSPALAAGQTASEPLSKTYRVTRANDVEFQKVEPFKVFDNLYYVGPGYVSVWLLTTPEGNILFDSAQEPYVDWVINNIRKVGVDPKSIKYIILSHGHLDHFGGAAKIQEESVTSANKVAQIQGVQVNLQIHSWAGDDGYPGGGVLERGVMLKSRKPGDPHPFVDPATFAKWVKRSQEEAAKAVQQERQKAALK